MRINLLNFGIDNGKDEMTNGDKVMFLHCGA